jgi:hypothetical protein
MRPRATLESPAVKLVGLIVFGLALAVAATGRADGQDAAGQTWGSLDFAGGSMRRTVFGSTDSVPQGFAGATFGKVLDRHLLVGVSLGARAALDFSDDVTPGNVNLSCLGVARFYPTTRSGLHLRLGGGPVLVGNSTFEDMYLGQYRFGAAWEAGVGYDIRVGRHGYVTPFVTQSRTWAGADVAWRAVTVGVSFTFSDR